MEESFDPVGEIPDNRLSFSKLKTFTTCPRKFYLQYVEKARGLVRIPLLLGSSWHRGQEHGIKAMIEKQTPKTKEVVEVAVESLKLDLKKTQRLDFTEFDQSKAVAKDDLKKMTEHGFDQIAKTFRPVASESEFTFKLDAETNVSGRIDCREKADDGSDGITELKTTTRKPVDLTVFDPQTTIYQNSQKGIKLLKKFFVIRHQNKNRDVTILQFKKKADSPQWVNCVIDSIKQIKEMIKTCSVHGYPYTSDLTTCSWCAYRFGCRPEIFKFEEASEKIIQKEILFSTNPKTREGIENEDSYKESRNTDGRNQTGSGLADHSKRSRDDNRSSGSLPNNF